MPGQVGTTGNKRRVWQSANWRWMTKIGGMNHAEDEKGSARGWGGTPNEPGVCLG